MNDDETPIGYKNPPHETRFKKGQSGNPKGRPKGSIDPLCVLRKALNDTVIVNEGGNRRKLTKLDVMLTQIVNKAAAGDLSAMKFLMPYIERIQKIDAAQVQITKPVTAKEAAETYRKLIKRSYDLSE